MVIGLPPAPDFEKVRTGNYSLIWSGLTVLRRTLYLRSSLQRAIVLLKLRDLNESTELMSSNETKNASLKSRNLNYERRNWR